MTPLALKNLIRAWWQMGQFFTLPKMKAPSTEAGHFSWLLRGWMVLAEESQQNLRPLIGKAQRLDTKLLTNLQRLKR